MKRTFTLALLLASCAHAGSAPRATPAVAPTPAPLAGTWEVESGALLVLTQDGSALSGYWQTEEQSQPLTGTLVPGGSFTLTGRGIDASFTVSGQRDGERLALTLTRAVAGSRIRSETKTTARRRAGAGALP